MKKLVVVGILLFAIQFVSGLSVSFYAQTLAHSGAVASNEDKDVVALNLSEFKTVLGYPEIAREADIHGRVVVRVLVDAQGNYVKHVVVKSTSSWLTQHVEKNLPMLHFAPAIKNGQSVSEWVTIPLDFKLN